MVIHIIVWFQVNSFIKIEENKIYQWGNLFPSNLAIKTDADMQEVNSDSLFDKRELLTISAKFKLAGAIVKH